MKNKLLFCLSFSSIVLIATNAMAIDKSNTGNVTELETIVFGAPTNTGKLTEKGKTSAGNPCKISIQTTANGISISVQEDGKSLASNFRLSKSAQVSQLNTVDEDEGIIRESQVNVTETEQADLIISESLTLSHNENPGSKGNIASVKISDNQSTSSDSRAPSFDPTHEVTQDCVAN